MELDPIALKGGFNGPWGLPLDRVVKAMVLGATLAACSPAPPPPPVPALIEHLEGRVLQQVDAPPYSYLQVETEEGVRWVALPVGTYPREGFVQVRQAVLVGSRQLKALGRTLDGVYFGQLVTR